MGNVEFEDTYLDIIAAAKIDISRGVDSTVRKKYLDILQKISNGKVTLHEDRFYLKPGTQAKLEFNLVAEGLRKIALLWQLIKNGTLEKGSVLFWDEPEANINPKYIPVLACLLYTSSTCRSHGSSFPERYGRSKFKNPFQPRTGSNHFHAAGYHGRKTVRN